MAGEAKAHDDESEDEGMGVVAMRDEAVSAVPIWQLQDCAACSDEDAVKGFLLETLRHACADFLRHRDYKGVAYFLHAGAESQQRALSSVNVALGFRSKGSNQECHECLRALASEKQVSFLLCLSATRARALCGVLAHISQAPTPPPSCARQPPLKVLGVRQILLLRRSGYGVFKAGHDSTCTWLHAAFMYHADVGGS